MMKEFNSIFLIFIVASFLSSSINSSQSKANFSEFISFIREVTKNVSADNHTQEKVTEILAACEAFEKILEKLKKSNLFFEQSTNNSDIFIPKIETIQKMLYYRAKSNSKLIEKLNNHLEIYLMSCSHSTDACAHEQENPDLNIIINEIIKIEKQWLDYLANDIHPHEELITFINITPQTCFTEKRLFRDLYKARNVILKQWKQLKKFFVSNYHLPSNPNQRIFFLNDKLIYNINCNTKVISMLDKSLTGEDPLKEQKKTLLWKFADNVIFCLVTVAIIPVVIIGGIVYTINYFSNLTKA